MDGSQRKKENKSVSLLLCIAGLLLLNWPLLSIFGDGGGFPTIAYLFFIWLCLIGCLSWYCAKEAAKTPKDIPEENA
jgi:hypothetical protein